MQDIHSIGGGGGRLFGGGGDRRLRPHHHHHQQNQQTLKCPRCDSLNTKFCYYNNYNLSQPRHFCKSCRRYWTKGGVLRCVPVGGGCRKTKRSKPKSSSDAPPDRKSNSHSSSESSSLTASTTAATMTSTTTAAATPEVASASPSTFPDSRFFNISQNTNPSFDPPLIDQLSDDGIFPEIGSFANLMTSSNDHHQSLLGFNFNISDVSASAYRFHQQNHGTVLQNQKMHEDNGGFLDQTAQIDLSGANNGGVEALDWEGGGDQNMFDLTGTVDQAYWSQQTQWTDNDQALYLP
ncbi:hypothetical protein ACSBR2_041735 [Camellia fascicularis]